MATYKHLRSSTANKRPTTGIADGQLAINTNTASPGLFFKDSAGTGIVKVGPVHVGTTAPNATPAAGGSTGNYTGEQWLDTSVSPAQMKVWNGSAWVGVVADELPVSKLQDGAARQLLQTDAAGTGVEWTSNVDVPGTLDVTSTATFDSIARHPLGSAAAPTLTFTGDPNTGIYSPGADQVAVATNGSGRLFVDASGNVGIANSSPTNARLLVGDDLGAITTAARMVQVGHPSGGMLILGKDNTDYSYFTHEASTQTSNWFYRGGAGITLNSAGLVGIGTSAPGQLLDVAGVARFGVNATKLTTYSDSTYAGFFNGSSLVSNESIYMGGGNTFFYNNGSPSVTIDSTGRVGIGTTSPGSAFEVKPSASSATLGIQAGTINTDSIRIQAAGTANTYLEYRGYLGHAWFVDATERARIDSSGRLLIGTSSARSGGPYGTAGLQVESTSFTNASISAINNENTSDGVALMLGKSRGSSIGSTTIVSSGDQIGGVYFQGADGSALRPAASIFAEVDGTPGANDMPGRLIFATTADGAASPTERMRITSAGRVGIGSTAPATQFAVQNASTSLGIEVDTTSGFASGPTVRGYYRPGSAYTTLGLTGSQVAFGIQDVEKARIDSSGRLLVGTSSSTGSLSNTAPVIAGLFQSFDDVATFTTGVAQTLFVIPNTNATYIVTLRRGSVGDAANYEAVSILSTNSGGSVSAVLTDLKTAANVLISISGTNLQGTQSSGGSASLRWVVTRVG